MRRLALKPALFLLLGAIFNVGVAWGCAAIVNPLANAAYKVDGQSAPQGQWLHFEAAGTSLIWVYGARPAASLPGWVHVRQSRSQLIMAEARGWPMRSMWQNRDVKFRTVDGIALQVTPYETWFGAKYFRALPLHPHWPGFAIDTIFYAAILWLPFPAIGGFRRRCRIKRGLCPKCAYDLRGCAGDSKTCPECGRPRLA